MDESIDISTANLLAAVEMGKSDAMQELLTLHRPYLKRVVQLRMDPILATRIDASDVVQEAQLVIFKRMDDFLRRRPTSFRLWIRQHVLECLIDEHRRHVTYQKRSVLKERDLADASSFAIARRLMEDSPSRLVRQMELREQITDAIDKLSENDRQVLSLRHAERLSNAEVAELLGIPANTVRQRYGRALKRLHQVLTDQQISLDGTLQ
ncbi:MAG: sigma-70 family RNA polymerase sigma factor [Planctomycetales bacterium]|nr:sigma-70 family RNA polymerase sigma factor [Planctomycetales bacterium]